MIHTHTCVYTGEVNIILKQFESTVSIKFRFEVEQRFCQEKKTTQLVRCPECRKWIHKERMKAVGRDSFQDDTCGPQLSTAIVARAMCEGWWTENQSAYGNVGCKHLGRSNDN